MGYQTNKSGQIVAGIIVLLMLAAVIDVLIVLAGRLATPWERAGHKTSRRRAVVAPVTGGAR
jgi:osmoprotectant transport system permease protein